MLDGYTLLHRHHETHSGNRAGGSLSIRLHRASPNSTLLGCNACPKMTCVRLPADYSVSKPNMPIKSGVVCWSGYS